MLNEITKIIVYDKEDLYNIDSFITMLTSTFKLKTSSGALTTEVFIDRWRTNCGNSTYFAPELFQAFCNMIIASYCGGGIVNQKSIDSICGVSEVKLADAILKLGDALLLNNRTRLFESDNEIVEENFDDIPSIDAKELKSILEIRTHIPEKAKFIKEDCTSKDATKSRIQSMIEYYIQSEQEEKLAEKACSFAKMAIKAMSTTKNKEEYQIGVLEAILAPTVKYIKGREKENLIDAIQEAVSIQREYIDKYRLSDKEFTKVLTSQL